MTDKLYILIDIGGTAIKHGIAKISGELIERHEIPTEAKTKGGPGIVEKVHKIIKNAIHTHTAETIGGVSISTAGMVNPESGEIIYALPDAIPDYTGVNFKAIVEKQYNLPCEVENDVNCAALGEMWQGGGKGCNSVFCMTIGTSIGGAMIQDGKLVSGASNSAGEIAYMRIPGGMIHELASTTYLVKHYAQLANVDPSIVNGKIIFDAAEGITHTDSRLNGDTVKARQAINDFVEHLTDGICNVVTVQNPQAIILGGGIMARANFLRPIIASKLQEKLRPLVFDATRIEFAKLQNDAGMLGSLYNFKKRQQLQAHLATALTHLKTLLSLQLCSRFNHSLTYHFAAALIAAVVDNLRCSLCMLL